MELMIVSNNGSNGSTNSQTILRALIDLQAIQQHKQELLNRELQLIQVLITASAFTNIDTDTMAELLATRAAIG